MPPADPAASFRFALEKAEAVRIEAIADSWKSSKDRADQYTSIARDLKKEARKLEKRADAFLQDAAAETNTNIKKQTYDTGIISYLSAYVRIIH